MLAISAYHDKIKILVNDYGRLLLQTSVSNSIDASGHLSESTQKVLINHNPLLILSLISSGGHGIVFFYFDFSSSKMVNEFLKLVLSSLMVLFILEIHRSMVQITCLTIEMAGQAE